MNEKIKIMAVLAALVTMGVGGAAQAAIVTQIQSLNSISTTTDTAFNGFNVAGGTLTGVALGWNMSAALRISADLCDDEGDCADQVNWTFRGLSGAFGTGLLDSDSQPTGLDQGTDEDQLVNVQMALADSTSFSNLASFLGGASIGSVRNFISMNGCCELTVESLTGTITLTYTYDVGRPPTIPEPATLALLGLGLAGLGFSRRKH